MRHPIFSLLALSSVGLAGSPRLASEELSDVKSALQAKGEFGAGRLVNASFTGFESLSGLDLFPRQSTCGTGRKRPYNRTRPQLTENADECSDGKCCKSYQNCVRGGCCDKPEIGCGADSCYNPDVETCCEARGTRCDLGYECVPSGGCCKKGRKSCGSDSCYDPEEDECCGNGKTCPLGDTCVDGGCCDGYKRKCGSYKCYDPILSVCCTDGDFSWSCPKGNSCCRSSRSCYRPSTEKCCSSGACRKGETCCEHGCCDSSERCGADGYCTVTSTSTSTTTSLSDATATITVTSGSDSDDDEETSGGGVAGADGTPGDGQGNVSGASGIRADEFLKLASMAVCASLILIVAA
ncbi:hypothetical protein P170DRAFT_478204 [Aspergillus steynii IBT 23096]|uniref:GPI anchored protein n=1 Tax=Aspergillus steynii IBT 23096 TaxID=1392250 RepID=A0A2I2G3A3_9EURO|nr:uncharacterized protein P170DRAFT_478204 [Aspergillus steynii IBT 23096]PLB47352.1 hypothetical protein P170DRAFT_478204 [Aspergillus steynii IBT 23096]